MTTSMNVEEAIVSRVASLASAGALEPCAAAARQGRRSVRDPLKMGWLYYFEYKCLYSARRYSDAYRLFHEIKGPKPTPIAFTENNAIWIHSVAMELAFRVGDFAAIDVIAAAAKKLAANQPARVGQLEETRKSLVDQAATLAKG